VIDAANEFVPVAGFTNNVPGKDAEVLKSFNEPAWNNPVVRFSKTYEKRTSSRAKTACTRRRNYLVRMTAH